LEGQKSQQAAAIVAIWGWVHVNTKSVLGMNIHKANHKSSDERLMIVMPCLDQHHPCSDKFPAILVFIQSVHSKKK
jgi:hypothetical protein